MKDGKITYKELYGGQGLEISRTVPYEGKFSYPIVEVPSLDVRFSSHPGKPYPHCHLDVKATLLVRDAVDDERFLYDVNDVFDFDAMEEEDDSGEGLIFPKEGLTVEEIALSFIHSELPIRLTRKD